MDALDDIGRGLALVGLSFIPGLNVAVATGLAAAGYTTILGGLAQELTSLPRRPRQSAKGNVTGGTNPMPLVFGTRRVGGQFCYAGVSNSAITGGFYHLVVAHSLAHAGGISDITDLYIDGVAIADADIDGSGDVTSGQFTSVLNVRRYLGTSAQTVDTALDTAFSDIDSNFRGRGVAYTAIRCERVASDKEFQEDYPRGLGFQFSAIVKGILCYDPRLDSTNGGSGSHRYTDPTTWAYTANPALIAATYAIMETTDGGAGLDPATEVYWASVSSAANTCEETRTVPDGASGSTTESRYECHIVLSTADSVESNLTAITDCMAGKWAYSGGKLHIHAGVYTAPAVTIDESWLRGSPRITTKRPLNERFNAVKVSFANAAAAYREEFAVAYTSTAQETADDSQTLWKETNLRGVTGQYQAQYLRNIIARRGLQEASMRVPLNFMGLDLEPWQTVNMSLTEPGISAVFRVIGWEMTPDGPDVELVAEASSVYTSTFATDYTEKNPTSTPASNTETPVTPS